MYVDMIHIKIKRSDKSLQLTHYTKSLDLKLCHCVSAKGRFLNEPYYDRLSKDEKLIT